MNQRFQEAEEISFEKYLWVANQSSLILEIPAFHLVLSNIPITISVRIVFTSLYYQQVLPSSRSFFKIITRERIFRVKI